MVPTNSFKNKWLGFSIEWLHVRALLDESLTALENWHFITAEYSWLKRTWPLMLTLLIFLFILEVLHNLFYDVFGFRCPTIGWHVNMKRKIAHHHQLLFASFAQSCTNAADNIYIYVKSNSFPAGRWWQQMWPSAAMLSSSSLLPFPFKTLRVPRCADRITQNMSVSSYTCL